MKRFVIRDSEAGNVIESCNTLEHARMTVERFKQEDLFDLSDFIPQGRTENFYEIYDSINDKIVE